MATQGAKLLPDAKHMQNASKMTSHNTYKSYNEDHVSQRARVLAAMQQRSEYLEDLERQGDGADLSLIDLEAPDTHTSGTATGITSTTAPGRSRHGDQLTYENETSGSRDQMDRLDIRITRDRQNMSLPILNASRPDLRRSTRSEARSESGVDALKNMQHMSDKEKRQMQLKISHVRGMLSERGLSQGWKLVDMYQKEQNTRHQAEELVLSCLIRKHLAQKSAQSRSDLRDCDFPEHYREPRATPTTVRYEPDVTSVRGRERGRGLVDSKPGSSASKVAPSRQKLMRSEGESSTDSGIGPDEPNYPNKVTSTQDKAGKSAAASKDKIKKSSQPRKAPEPESAVGDHVNRKTNTKGQKDPPVKQRSKSKDKRSSKRTNIVKPETSLTPVD